MTSGIDTAGAEAAPEERMLAAWSALLDQDPVADEALVAGPSVAELAARLNRVPREFLDPRADARALVRDLALPVPAEKVTEIVVGLGIDGAARAAAVTVWLWAADDVPGVAPLSVPVRRDRASTVLAATALRLASAVPVEDWLRVADRREEACRTVLRYAGQLPAGEDPAVARGEYELRDSVRRNERLARALDDHRHRQAVARRLAERAAREAASRYSPE